MKVTGHCHCGAIQYEAEVDPSRVQACHCTDCQRLSGSPYRASVGAPKETFRLLKGTPKIYVKTAESGNQRARLLRRLRIADLFIQGERPADVFAACRLSRPARAITAHQADLVSLIARLGNEPGGYCDGRAAVGIAARS
jgi:hypothetical protein